MDGIFFGRNRNNLVALYPYSQALRKGSKSCAIYWIKEIEDITRRREDMNFIFEWSKQYFTNERSE